MLCAAMAVETIEEAVWRDDFRVKRLIRYERAWTRAIGQELKAGLSLRQLFDQLSDAQIDAMVELGGGGRMSLTWSSGWLNSIGTAN